MTQYTDRFDEIILKDIKNGKIAGANICILKDGKELFYQNYGMADIKRNIPVKRDTIFRMYSMSKPITAASVMLLFERGAIDLYEPVSNYLPSFKEQKVYENGTLVAANRQATIHDLLNMTSGLVYPDDTTPEGICMKEIFDDYIEKALAGEAGNTVDFCNKIGECPLAFQPGTEWRYGTSADILGAVVEVVSGMKFGEFLRKEFFEPLGMVDTGFYVPEEKWDRLAEFYEFDQNEKLIPYLGHNLAIMDHRKNSAFESGGAGLVSTIDDYAKFASMLINEGESDGKRYLGKKTVRFMRTNQLLEKQKVSLNWDSVRGYGYGNMMRILENQSLAGTNASLGEFGWDGWTGNYITMDPTENFIFMYFIQRCGAGTTETTRKLRAVAYSMLND